MLDLLLINKSGDNKYDDSVWLQ